MNNLQLLAEISKAKGNAIFHGEEPTQLIVSMEVMVQIMLDEFWETDDGEAPTHVMGLEIFLNPMLLSGFEVV